MTHEKTKPGKGRPTPSELQRLAELLKKYRKASGKKRRRDYPA